MFYFIVIIIKICLTKYIGFLVDYYEYLYLEEKDKKQINFSFKIVKYL